MVLPSFVSAFGIFPLQQFFLNIPAELENAAHIDGCSRWGILWWILVPLSKPALITRSALFTFMGAWNAFEWPLAVRSNENLYPLTVGLALFRDQNTQDWPRILAGGVMGSLPLIALFYAAQRFLTIQRSLFCAIHLPSAGGLSICLVRWTFAQMPLQSTSRLWWSDMQTLFSGTSHYKM